MNYLEGLNQTQFRPTRANKNKIILLQKQLVNQ